MSKQSGYRIPLYDRLFAVGVYLFAAVMFALSVATNDWVLRVLLLVSAFAATMLGILLSYYYRLAARGGRNEGRNGSVDVGDETSLPDPG